MRRFIDVVFIHPKNRYYVVLHQGKFWQLARMNLTVSSWVFKLLYKGSLGDIFVARNQAVVDEKLSKILKTYELPAELHGLNANRFLDWWEMNDYKWLSTKDVITLDALPTVAPKPVEPPKTVITPAALAILQKKRLINEQSDPVPSTATSTPINTPTSTPIDIPVSKPNPAKASAPILDNATPDNAVFDEVWQLDEPKTPPSRPSTPAPLQQTPPPAPTPAASPAVSALADFDEDFSAFDVFETTNTTSTTNSNDEFVFEAFETPAKIDLTNDTNQLNQLDEFDKFDTLLGNNPTATQTTPAQDNAAHHDKTIVNDSLLGRFKLSPQADFTPNSAIASPIPNPPPNKPAKPDVELDMGMDLKFDTPQSPPTQPTPQESMSMPQPASRPMSKLHEFNAQYAKKSVSSAQERPASIAVPRPAPTPTNPIQTTITPTAPAQPARPMQSASPASIAPQTITPNPSPRPMAMAQATPSPAMTAQTMPSPPTPALAPEPKARTSVLDESFDIFDDLLKELTDELIP